MLKYTELSLKTYVVSDTLHIARYIVNVLSESVATYNNCNFRAFVSGLEEV